MKDKIKKAIRFINMAAMVVFMGSLLGVMIAGTAVMIGLALHQAVMSDAAQDRIAGWVLFIALAIAMSWRALSHWAKES